MIQCRQVHRRSRTAYFVLLSFASTFTSIVVAWVFAVFSTFSNPPTYYRLSSGSPTPIICTNWHTLGGDRVFATPDHTRTTDAITVTHMPAWCHDYIIQMVTDDPSWHVSARHIDAFGWPWRALSCAPPFTSSSFGRIEGNGTIDLPAKWGYEKDEYFGRGLPLWPIWHGLLLNTLFYFILFYAVLFALARVVYSLRLARMLCPNCRYPLHGLSNLRCPECGWHY